jgi:hypothetical protein
MDIVVLAGEYEIITAVNDIQATIDRKNLNTRVTVYTIGDVNKLVTTLKDIQATALRDADEAEPAAAVAEATAFATAQLLAPTLQATLTSEPNRTIPPLQSTPTQPLTNTPLPPSPTHTPIPATLTPTHTLRPTDTLTPKNTSTPTFTPLPKDTLTSTFTPTSTYTPTHTLTPTLTPTYTSSPTYTPTTHPDCATWAWEFSTDGDSEGWRAGQFITIEIREGFIRGNITQPKGFWIAPNNLNIDAAIFKTLKIKYRVASSEIDEISYIYWIKADDAQYGNNKKFKFDVQAGNVWREDEFDLSSIVNWSGTVTGIQLYPAWFSSAGTSVEYDYIRLCK